MFFALLRATVITPQCFFLRLALLLPRGGLLHSPAVSLFSFTHVMVFFILLVISFILLVVRVSSLLRFFFFFVVVVFLLPLAVLLPPPSARLWFFFFLSSSSTSRTVVVLLLPLQQKNGIFLEKSHTDGSYKLAIHMTDTDC